jgi:hypothetical protein
MLQRVAHPRVARRRRLKLRRFKANESVGKNHRKKEPYPVIHHHHQQQQRQQQEQGVIRVATAGTHLCPPLRAHSRWDQSRFRHLHHHLRHLPLARLLIFQKQNSAGAR